MANHDLIITLAKVIIATAWADGDVSHDELNSLKDLLFRIPGLNATEWAELDMYIDAPVGAAERERLIADLVDRVRSPADRELVFDALDDLIRADGDETADERAVADQIKAALQEKDVSIAGAFKRLFTGPIQRRGDAVNGPNREHYFEDFLQNRVYYDVQRRLRRGGRGDQHPGRQITQAQPGRRGDGPHRPCR
jgi:hypothetical protein